MDAMPLADRAALMDCATATGSSPSPSLWLLMKLGRVPADLRCCNQVCQPLAFCCGVKAAEGPTMGTPGARLWMVRTAVSHIWKYWVLFQPPPPQKMERSGSFQ